MANQSSGSDNSIYTLALLFMYFSVWGKITIIKQMCKMHWRIIPTRYFGLPNNLKNCQDSFDKCKFVLQNMMVVLCTYIIFFDTLLEKWIQSISIEEDITNWLQCLVFDLFIKYNFHFLLNVKNIELFYF